MRLALETWVEKGAVVQPCWALAFPGSSGANTFYYKYYLYIYIHTYIKYTLYTTGILRCLRLLGGTVAIVSLVREYGHYLQAAPA